jgi:hypothetical protein
MLTKWRVYKIVEVAKGDDIVSQLFSIFMMATFYLTCHGGSASHRCGCVNLGDRYVCLAQWHSGGWLCQQNSSHP